ncbi:MAG: glycine cleavage system transcriptional repressor [Sulfuricaulis sp.]
MKKYFVISALGSDRPGIVNQLSKTILECGCNIEDSRQTVLGGECAVILMVSGHWGAITRLERQLPVVEKKLALTLLSRHTEPRAGAKDMVPYTVDVVAMDHPGIVHDIADFFAGREINIEEMSTWTYPAAHTGTPMFSLNMTVSIPASIHIGRLRDEFTVFCDNLNLDALLEPARN